VDRHAGLAAGRDLHLAARVLAAADDHPWRNRREDGQARPCRIKHALAERIVSRRWA